MTGATTRITKVTLGNGAGSTTDITGIVSVRDRIVGSGAGETQATPRYVANTVPAVGFLYNHKHWEIEITQDEDAYFWFTQDVTGSSGAAIVDGGDNHLIKQLIVTEERAGGDIRTWTYQADKTIVVKGPDDTIKMDQNSTTQPKVVTLVCIGTKSVGSWGAP